MMQFFNEQMSIAKLAMEDGEPIISSQINVEKNFAFLEFRNTEECTKAMMFDGIAVRGQTVKIRRPKDYQPPAGADPDPVAPQHVAGVISTVVADTPHKVYIGGLPFDLKDEHCKELLQTFGPLKAFHLVTDPQSGMSKGFAFCEYVDPAITALAIQGLNDMQIGDKKLLVQFASVGAKNNQQGGMMRPGMPGMPPPPSSLAMPGAPPGMQFEPVIATRVLVLMNMVTMDDLTDPEEYDEIKDDVRGECERCGIVTGFEMPRPGPNGEPVPGMTKIFVEFANTQGSQTAQQALSGRVFDGRRVVTSYLEDSKFANRQFD